MLTISNSPIYAQDENQHRHFQGIVMGIEQHETFQDTIPLIGANVYWEGTSIGTITNTEGIFHLDKPGKGLLKLVVSYVAYENDTLNVQEDEESIVVILDEIRESAGAEISAEKPHTYNLSKNTLNTQVISKTGLRTLACCNLSESFENTSAVDVEKSDAISGAKRIKMLGLAGFYTQVLVEKKPVIRGLISPFALDYIPGTWMESIDISKGTASVMTGYESTTGQINVEFKKPEKDEPVFFNLYQNSLGKTESSGGGSYRFNDNLSTMLLAYGFFNRVRHDKNNDTFLDMPLMGHLHLMNRWKLQQTKGWVGQFGFKFLHENRNGGQKSFDFKNSVPSPVEYGFHTKTRRMEVFSKIGRVLDKDGTSSIGLIFSAFQHKNDAFWGMKTYNGTENSMYSNLIFQRSLEKHIFATGVSFTWDTIDEYFNEALNKRTEEVPGTFVEYTWKPNAKWTSIVGFRYDFHNLYGNFYTPRIHIKYLWSSSGAVRLSAGKGFRSPHIFMENLSILASSKELNMVEKPEAEEAWNYGIQLTKDFVIGEDRPASLMADFYRTSFQNRIIVDTEQDAGQIYVYNLDGPSYSNSFQLELNGTLFSGFESTIAWRWNDVKMTIKNKLLEQPLTNRHKGLFVLSYTTKNNNWQFDLTTQLNGKTRLPNTEINPENYRTTKYSPSYAMLFGQIKRKFDRYEFYLGMENITNYKQSNPILAWQEPFSPYFDSSMIWGPTIGRRIYVGIRVN
jgi:outer membrane receptor for ferrienterochelin and colicins